MTVRLSITSDQWPEKLVPHVPGHHGCSVLSRGPWMGRQTPPEAALLVFPPDIERNPLRPRSPCPRAVVKALPLSCW